MKNEKITVDLTNLTEDDRNKLLDLIEKSQHKNKRCKPEYNERYWYINRYGMIFKAKWYYNSSDECMYRLRNCFKTKKEAEFEVEKRKVTAELFNYADEHNEHEIDWNGTYYDKWFLTYNFVSNKIGCNRCIMDFLGLNIPYFTSESIAKAAIKEIGEDRIKKYYFGVDMCL